MEGEPHAEPSPVELIWVETTQWPPLTPLRQIWLATRPDDACPYEADRIETWQGARDIEQTLDQPLLVRTRITSAFTWPPGFQ